MKRFLGSKRNAESGVFQDAAPIKKLPGPVIWNLTLPGGKKVRILREDIYQRALHPEKAKAGT